MEVAPERLELRASDGYRLGATLFRPGTANGRALQIQAAAGVRQEYYAPFCAYLASRGFAVLTFDYRGIGRSLDGHPKRLRACMRDWALVDAACAFSFLQESFAKDRLCVVGHSFGGQALAVLPGAERLHAALAVGSQSGYWRHWSGATRAGMWLLVHALLPGLTRLCGYFPAAALGQGENLPPGVAIEWARWCRDPGYLVGALGLRQRAAAFRAPLRLYAIADDLYAPRRSVEALLELMPNARGEVRAIDPADLGVERIGHFGFFRERFRDTLWREAADWLEANSGSEPELP